MNWKRKILTIWLGQSISLLTSCVLQMAIVWYITLTTGSAMMLTLATICGFVPQAFLGIFTGPIIDRFPKKWVIILADSLIACTSIILAVVTLTGDLPLWLIYVVLVLRSLGTAFHEPAVHALTPLLVPTTALTQYAGYAQAFDCICHILSPALSIILYLAWDLSLIMLLDVLGAAIAIAIVLLVALPKENIAPTKSAKPSLIQDTKSGIAYLRTQEGILPLMFLAMMFSILYSPIGTLYPHITMVYFGGTTTQSGLVEMVFAAGSLLGALLLGRLASKIPKLGGVLGSIFLYGLGVCVIGLLTPSSYVLFAFISFFVGITTPFFHGITRAIYQTTIPQEYLGRTFAIAQSCNRIGMPIGLILGGLFADSSGINILYSLAGGLAMVLALSMSRFPSLRRFKNL